MTPTEPRRLFVRSLWVGSAPGAWVPLPTGGVLRVILSGALAGSIALLGVLLGPTLILGARDLTPALVAFVPIALIGAVQGAAIGLVAGLGWRIFAVVVGPIACAFLPLRAGAFGAALNYFIAGCIASGWIFYATRRR